MTKPFHDPTEPLYTSTKRCAHGLLFYPCTVRCFDCEIVWLKVTIADAEEKLEKAKRKLKKVLEEQKEARK